MEQYQEHSSYAPKKDDEKKQDNDTEVSWVTIPRLVLVTLISFLLTIYFNGIT